MNASNIHCIPLIDKRVPIEVTDCMKVFDILSSKPALPFPIQFPHPNSDGIKQHAACYITRFFL